MVGVPSDLTEEDVKAFVVPAGDPAPRPGRPPPLGGRAPDALQGAPLHRVRGRAAPHPDRPGGQAPAAAGTHPRRVGRGACRWVTTTGCAPGSGGRRPTPSRSGGATWPPSSWGRLTFSELAFFLTANRMPSAGRDPAVRRRPRGPGRPRPHPERPGRPAHLDRRHRVPPGLRGRRPARRRQRVPRRGGGHRPLPGRRPLGATRRDAEGGGGGRDRRRAAHPGARPPRPQGRGPPHAPPLRHRRRGRHPHPPPEPPSHRRRGPRRGHRQEPAHQRRRRRRGRLGRPRLPTGDREGFRPPGPHRRA